MKWNNRGNELDVTSKIICDKNNEFYLWGAGEGCYDFVTIFSNKINILGIYDIDLMKQGHFLNDIPILPIGNLENKKIIITTNDYYKEIPETLEKYGLVLNKDYFFKKDFEGIYNFYKERRLEIDWMNLIVTDKCSLKCKDCMMLVPFFNQPMHQKMEKLKDDINLTFKTFDFIKSYQIVGGEPLIYPGLEDIIEYIGENYLEKIGRLLITTNGTVLPDISFFKMCQKYNIYIRISDYRNSEKINNQEIEKWISLLSQFKVNYEMFGTGSWYDFGNPADGCAHVNEKLISSLYQYCDCVHSTIRDGKWFTCCRQAAAVWSKVIDLDENDYLDIKVKDVSRNELLEYYLKFSTKGWLSCCEACFGDGTIMKNREVDAAEQID